MTAGVAEGSGSTAVGIGDGENSRMGTGLSADSAAVFDGSATTCGSGSLLSLQPEAKSRISSRIRRAQRGTNEAAPDLLRLSEAFELKIPPRSVGGFKCLRSQKRLDNTLG